MSHLHFVSFHPIPDVSFSCCVTDVLAVDGNLSINSGGETDRVATKSGRQRGRRDNLTDIHKTRQKFNQILLHRQNQRMKGYIG